MPKQSILYGILFGVVMAALWSVVFINLLGFAGIGIGIALGVAFAMPGAVIGAEIEKKRKK